MKILQVVDKLVTIFRAVTCKLVTNSGEASPTIKSCYVNS